MCAVLPPWFSLYCTGRDFGGEAATLAPHRAHKGIKTQRHEVGTGLQSCGNKARTRTHRSSEKFSASTLACRLSRLSYFPHNSVRFSEPFCSLRKLQVSSEGPSLHRYWGCRVRSDSDLGGSQYDEGDMESASGGKHVMWVTRDRLWSTEDALSPPWGSGSYSR